MSGAARGAVAEACGRIAAASAGLSSMFAELSTATYAMIAVVESEGREGPTRMDDRTPPEPQWESPTRSVTAVEFEGESEFRSLFERFHPDPTLVAVGSGGFPAALTDTDVLALVPGATAGDVALEVATAVARDDARAIDALLREGADELEAAYGAEPVAAFMQALTRFTELDARGAAWRS